MYVNVWRGLFLGCLTLLVSSQEEEDDSNWQHVGAVFEREHFSAYWQTFQAAVSRVNEQMGTSLQAVTLPTLNDVHESLIYVCDALHNQNITSFLVIGGQDTINTLTTVTQYVGIPVLAYNTDLQPVSVQGERSLYLQLDPTKTILAKVLVSALAANKWHYASTIMQDSYVGDGFFDAFKDYTSDMHWRIEDHVRLPSDASYEEIEETLHHLLEKESRVIVLHCSVSLARKVFQVARREGFSARNYAWFVTEDAVSRREQLIGDYPDGVLAVTRGHIADYEGLIDDAVALIGTASEAFTSQHGRWQVKEDSCWQSPLSQHWDEAELFYRYLKNSSIVSSRGKLSFTADGQRLESECRLLNLVTRPNGRRRWRYVGSFRNGTLQSSAIVWPGGSTSAPQSNGRMQLRVVTTVVEPYVMEQQAVGEHCFTGVPCLRVNTSDKNELDAIFRDYTTRVHRPRYPYRVHCCQGLSISLLERLARDVMFDYQLYLVADGRYGSPVNDSWDGLVGDLRAGAAHMAIAALSITHTRSSVIDFTVPYFYSGFSLIVFERQRQTPLYAFMEPFDSVVWVGVISTATVVAIALSLLEWNSPFGLNPWGRKRKSNYSLGSGINMVYAILFQHTIKTKSPKAWPSKWLQNFWAGASIFVYSSYTANLAAFLAGKNSGVTIIGMHDPQLLQPDYRIGTISGNAAEQFVGKMNFPLISRAKRYPSRLPMEMAMAYLMNQTIDAYIDDTPLLEYARSTMDSGCQLRIVSNGFGSDAYGIGLPRNSWLRTRLDSQIMKYRENGFIDELNDIYFRPSICKDGFYDSQHGGRTPMNFDQHAGLYLVLACATGACLLLLLLEHATFKWMVPYWRRKPANSFWKSLSMMFWSQRLYRIIASEELVSPHHSAREMIEVVRNRDFTKLFQKSVKKQDQRHARQRKNLFSVVEQLQWKQRRDERLSQQTSFQESLESDNSATPMNLSRDSRSSPLLRSRSAETSTSEAQYNGGGSSPNFLRATYGVGSQLRPPSAFHGARPPLVRSDCVHYDSERSPLECSTSKSDDDDDDEMPSDDPDENVVQISSSRDGRPDDSEVSEEQIDITIKTPAKHRRCTMPARKRKRSETVPRMTMQPSRSEQNLTALSADNCQTPFTNGVVVLSPNGDVFAMSASPRKDSVYIQPKNVTNLKNFTTNLPVSLKTLPLKDNRVKSTIMNSNRALLSDSVIANDIEAEPLDNWTKEDLYEMWKTSERELNSKLQTALTEKAQLEQKLAMLQPETEDT